MFAVVNPGTFIARGPIFNIGRAQRAKSELEESWPGILWEVREVDDLDGLVRIGLVSSKRKLKELVARMAREEQGNDHGSSCDKAA